MSKNNKIDEIVNNAFENFEMPYDASQWDLLQNKMDQLNAGNSFDNTVKNKLENHEVAYQPAAWSAVESQLVGSSVSYTKWIVAAGVIGLVSLGSYFLMNSNNNEVESNNQHVAKKKELANNTIENNNEIENSVVNEKATNETNKVENTDLVTSVDNSNSINNSVTTPIENNTSSTTNNSTNNVGTNNGNVVNNSTPIIVDNGPGVEVVKWTFAKPEIIGMTDYCSNEIIKLSSSELVQGVKPIWMLDGVEIGNENEISLLNILPGQHEIKLIHSAKNNISNCIEPVKSTSMQINVKESPKVDFTYKQIGDAYYPETKFETLSESEFDNLTWTLDGKSFTGEEVIYIFNKKGNYPVTVEATFDNGCTYTESKNIEINNDYNLLAPIAFTPNADGINDVFIPEALKVLNLPFKMTVYDRNQGYVYQTSRVDAPWNGRNLNTNEICGQGSYLWVVELTNKKGETELYSGTITLLK